MDYHGVHILGLDMESCLDFALCLNMKGPRLSKPTEVETETE